jgi:hypothetical protein
MRPQADAYDEVEVDFVERVSHTTGFHGGSCCPDIVYVRRHSPAIGTHSRICWTRFFITVGGRR